MEATQGHSSGVDTQEIPAEMVMIEVLVGVGVWAAEAWGKFRLQCNSLFIALPFAQFTERNHSLHAGLVCTGV